MEEQNADFNQIEDSNIGKVTKPTPAPKDSTFAETNYDWVSKLIDAGISGKLDTSVLDSFSNVAQNREGVYRLLDLMAQDPTIAAILETYAEDATEYNDEGRIVWVEADNPDILKTVDYYLQTLQVDKHVYQWAHNLCHYGDLYLKLYRNSELDKKGPVEDELSDKDILDLDEQKVLKEDVKLEEDANLKEDIKINVVSKNDHFAHYIEMAPNPAEMFELTRFGKTCGYIKADVRSSISQNTNNAQALASTYWKYNFKKSDVNIYSKDSYVHATLDDNSTRTPEEVSIFTGDNAKPEDEENKVVYTVRRGQSLLYNVFKIWRELSLLENSMLLNRVTKSAIIRLINVEVGDMPKENVGPHLQGIKSLMEQKSALTAGESLQEYTNPGPIENNIYVPTYNGKGAITAGQIGGDVNVGQLPDIEYFQNKFFGAVRIPKQYFGLTEDGAGFNGGQSLAIISSRYAKMIKRIQKALTQVITDAINLLLMDKDLSGYINKFTIRMQAPTTQEEIDRRESKRENVGITSDILNMLSDVEDPITKMKILKSLISNVITDTEVISLLEEEIKKLESGQAASNPENSENKAPNSAEPPIGGRRTPENDVPLNLDAELGLETMEGSGEESTGETSSETLPSPEELGQDFTNFD